MRIPVSNQRNFSGTLTGVDGETVILETATGEQRFAFDDVERARIVPRF